MNSSVSSVIDKCQHCSAPFSKSKPWQRFCRNACRQAASRELRRPEPECWEKPLVPWMTWCQKNLVVPTGLLKGTPFVIQPWQRQFFDALDNQVYKELGLSCPRKQGKTGLIAAFMLANLIGPLNTQNWEAVCCSLNAELAKALKKQIVQIAEASGLIDELEVRNGPGPGFIKGQNGTLVRFIAASRAGAHSMGCDVALIDEGGLFEERDRDLWESMITSLGTTNGRLIVISVRGHSQMFNEMEARKDDDDVYWLEFKAGANADIMDEEQWRKANPALGTIKSLDDMRKMAKRAAVTPTVQSSFRALHLNLPQAPDREMLCSPTDWQKLIVDVLPEREGPVVIGLDLGGSASMTAGAIYWPMSGRLECYGAFPDNPPLGERGQGDGCGGLYLEMERRGELRTFPGRTTPVDQFLLSLADRIGGDEIGALAADRYRKAEVLQVLEKVDLVWPIGWRGQGWLDGSADVRGAQQEILSMKPKVTESLMLTSAISESAVVRDPAGNPKLCRASRRGRIDAIQATVLALAAGHRIRARLESRREIRIHHWA